MTPWVCDTETSGRRSCKDTQWTISQKTSYAYLKSLSMNFVSKVDLDTGPLSNISENIRSLANLVSSFHLWSRCQACLRVKQTRSLSCLSENICICLYTPNSIVAPSFRSWKGLIDEIPIHIFVETATFDRT